MKLIKCNKCGRYFRVTDNDYCLSKCTGCGSTDLEETIYTLPESNIDWEQRRYEIAKDILATSHIAQQIGKYSYHCENGGFTHSRVERENRLTIWQGYFLHQTYISDTRTYVKVCEE